MTTARASAARLLAAGTLAMATLLPAAAPHAHAQVFSAVAASTLVNVTGQAALLSSQPVSTIAIHSTLQMEERTSASKPTIHQYLVAEGDTVRGIAEKFKIDVDTLLGANAEVARNPDLLKPGMSLSILPTNGALVTMAEGDTLVKVAQKFGVDAGEVVQFNQIPDADAVAVGSKLILPGAKIDATGEGVQTAAALAFQPLFQVQQGLTWVWPAAGVITSVHGEVGPTSPRGHAGLDIAAPVGTPIYAAADGVVERANDGGPYGLVIVVAHADGYETRYAHLSGFEANVGEEVKAGDLIGRMGSTGYSTGSHLHFELREGGSLVDPQTLLPRNRPN